MAYDPLTGRYTPDPVKPSTFTYGQGNPLSNVYVPPVAPAPQAPQAPVYRGFRAAEEASNIGAPVYTPTRLTETGEFATGPTGPTTPTGPTGPTMPTMPTGPTLGDLLIQQQIKQQNEINQQNRQSAYDLLFQQFNQYGLGALVEPLKELVTQNVSPSEFAIRLQNTDAYKKRFSANQDRIAQGLKALTPAEYIGLEDQYQNIMRNYGLPATYWTKDATGKQSGFDKFISNDVSATELENRLIAAQDKVLKSNPEVIQALKQFYPDITNGDIMAYALDPKNALKDIQRKVSAAEIGGAALTAGLTTDLSTAEQLAGYGISKAQAQQGFQTVADITPRGSQLAQFYGQEPYDQSTATAEVFGTAGATEASRKRRKLTQLEQAAFGGASGTAQGALARDKSGVY